MPRINKLLVGALAALSATALAACNSSTAGSPLPSSPSRPSTPPATTSSASGPKDVDLGGLDPCDSIPKKDYANLGIDGEARPGKNSGPMPDSRLCLWTTNATSFDVYYVAGEGIEAWQGGNRRSTATPVEPVHGYPAYSLQPALAQGDCNLLADVHSGQYVNVDVTPDEDNSVDPCGFAREVMTAVLSNLGA